MRLQDQIEPLNEPLPELSHDELGSLIELTRRIKGRKLRRLTIQVSLSSGLLIFEFSKEYRALQ